ncbi:MAG TPA: VCBS repeat-containing protein [Caldilineae bacterium]|nr:VCBS repeat-containing protein [Caldilineae bacterium]
MRLRYQILFTLTIFALAGIWLMTGSGAMSVSSADGIIPDDEIAYIDSNRYIQIVDPHTAPGTNPFTWTSPTLGWTDMTVSDVNADGVAELIAIGGNKVQMLTPYTPPGTVVPQFSRTIGSGFDYIWVVAGDFIPGDGGRDEILVQRTDSRAECPYSIQIFDGDDAGANWTMKLDNCYGAKWIRIRAGEVDGLEGDEIVMIRNGTSAARDRRLLIMKYAPDGTWPVLFQKGYGYNWKDLAIGNTHLNNGAIEEIILSRTEVQGVLNSFLIFQYHANNVSDAPDAQFKYYPHWSVLAAGDVNNSGDDEVFMVRDPAVSTGTSMIGRNWGADSMPSAWTSPGLSLGRNLKEVQMGDVDGDEKAEVVIGQPGSYRIYTEPGSNLNHGGDKAASFNSPIVIRLGNFDGQGVVTGPAKLAVDKTSLQFQMTRGESNPPAQTFMVYNAGGGGSIAYNVTRQIDGAWLNVTPFDGETAQTHTVSIDSTGLSAGVYDGTITITAVDPAVEESPQIIQVRLIIEATGPALSVSPTSISVDMNFGGAAPDPYELSIRNIGDGGPQYYSLEITTDDGGDWIKTNKYAGWTNDTAIITLDVRSLSSGDYRGNIHIDAGNIDGSPVDVPVNVTIRPTGMEVTPTSLVMQAAVGQETPRARININQSVPGQGGVHWYAYAVPSGDWWDLVQAYEKGELTVSQKDDGYVFTDSAGVESEINYVPWVILTPNNGPTPGFIQVTLDMDQAPVGDNHVTILVDGGPDTLNRFQGVDARILISDGGVWLPVMLAR